MLTVSGVVFIMTVPLEKALDKGSFFTFTGVAKNPYPNKNKETRKSYKVSIWAGKEDIGAAREKISKDTAIQIRIGELDTKMLDNGTCFAEVKSKWTWIEPLKVMPAKG